MTRRGVAEILIPLGVWRKGSNSITVELVGDSIRVTATPFHVEVEEWPARRSHLEEEGWVKDSPGSESNIRVKESTRPTLRMAQGYQSEVEIPHSPSMPTNIGVLPEEGVLITPPPLSVVPSEVIPDDLVSKIILPKDSVLRRKDGKLYLMAHQEGGWNNFSFPAGSEGEVAERFNVRLGPWSSDEHGEFCPVTKVPHRVVLKPPRPGS